MNLPANCANANWGNAPNGPPMPSNASARHAAGRVLAGNRSRWCFKALAAKWATVSRVIFAGIVAGLFFPLAARLGLSARSTVTPKVLRKMVWAGSNLGSYEMAEGAMRELGETPVSARRIRRMVNRIGGERVAEREAMLEQYNGMDLPKRQTGSAAIEPPQVAVTMMDGGRYQRRDHFGEKDRPAQENHWREDKVGCLLCMRSETCESDPTPELPAWLATSSAVSELAKIADNRGFSATAAATENPPAEASDEALYPAPQLVSREVIASGVEAESFGEHLAARAWQRGFPSAERQAFVADGARVNWTIHRRHFSRATPVLDLMHALSYAFSAAETVQEEGVFRRWAEWIWKGRVEWVIAALREHQERLGKPPAEASPTDPRARIDRALTYYEYHRLRMNYPEYRRLGLPLTSSHIESTVKQINRRVKGTEKFWSQPSSEAVLQLRADYLSDSAPLDTFWLRHQVRQTGVNTYAQTL
jgi:hypothetical protein